MEKGISCFYDASEVVFHRLVSASLLADSVSPQIPLLRLPHPWAAALLKRKRTLVISPAEIVEAIGFDATGDHPVSAETSRVGRLVVTGGMEPCIAVAIGAEKIDEAGRREPSTRVRVLHIYPFNMKSSEDIRTYVEHLRRSLIVRPEDPLHRELVRCASFASNKPLLVCENQNGSYEVRQKGRSAKQLLVFGDRSNQFRHDACALRFHGMKTRIRVAMHGGTDNPSSLRLSRDLRALFRDLAVEVEFDETCERRRGRNTPLGAVIMEDYRPRFITRLALLPSPTPLR